MLARGRAGRSRFGGVSLAHLTHLSQGMRHVDIGPAEKDIRRLRVFVEMMKLKR